MTGTRARSAENAALAIVADAAALDSAALLRSAGLRVTDSRRAVIEALGAHPHAPADELYRRVAVSVPQTSLQSVYNALGDLLRRGSRAGLSPQGIPDFSNCGSATTTTTWSARAAARWSTSTAHTARHRAWHRM